MHLPTSLRLALFLALCATIIALQAQTAADNSAKRAEAMQLYSQGKRLEALPLLEQLAQSNPKDDAVLLALAASLVDHAATLSDEQAAGKERMRALDLVNRARALGNTSTLAMNLFDLLKQLFASGTIKFSDNPQVQQIMAAGESAFSKRDFEAAIQSYKKAVQLEPANYSAVLFTGNAYDRMNNYSDAADWYQRAIHLNPDIETAYRYDADMAAKQGDMATARTMLIQAAVAEPYNAIVWREMRAWATLEQTSIRVVVAGISPQEGTADGSRP